VLEQERRRDRAADQGPCSERSRRLPRAGRNYRLRAFTQSQVHADVHAEDIVAVRYGKGKRRPPVPVPNFSGIDPVPM
jgi:hypothetical protein